MSLVTPLQGPSIETSRLLLRVPVIEDFAGYCEIVCDEDAARYIGGHLDQPGAWRRFLQMPGAWQLQGFAMFSIVEKSSGEFVGQVGPWYPLDWPGHEVGWAIRPKFFGKGYALEAAAATMDWAFDNLGWTRIVHLIHAPNEASKVLARRLGSHTEEVVELPPVGSGVEVELWHQSREEWATNRLKFLDLLSP